MSILVRRVETPAELELAYAIRHAVFVVEQNVPVEEELDAHDRAAVHVLAWDGERAIGTARMYDFEGRGKIGRVAVLAEARRRGVGDLLMDELERIAASQGKRQLVLDAQITVLPFYGKRGYVAEGPEFLDANILHRRMTRSLA